MIGERLHSLFFHLFGQKSLTLTRDGKGKSKHSVVSFSMVTCYLIIIELGRGPLGVATYKNQSSMPSSSREEELKNFPSSKL